MANLTHEQCKELKEWGLDSKIPTVTEMIEFAYKLAEPIIETCTICICFDGITHSAVAWERVSDVYYDEGNSFEEALFELIEEIVEASNG